MPGTLDALQLGIPAQLPEHPGIDASLPHAPRRPVALSAEDRALALKNALRYFPVEQHATLLPELARELDDYGHIYCYRLRPTAYEMRAHAIHEYPAACLQAASIQLMIMNNLDRAVAQYPNELITYGGNGSVFSNWAQYALTMRYLCEMSESQTLVLYSGHPLGLFPSSVDAPRLVITNGMVVPNYSSREMYERMYATGVTQYGQMTAGSYCYIGPQGIVHGTTITILAAARKYLGLGGLVGTQASPGADEASLAGAVYVSSGLGGMSGAQPKAAKIAGCVGVIAEVDAHALHKRHAQGWVEEVVDDVHACVARIRAARAARECVSIGFHGNVVTLWEALAALDEPLVDLGSDQTSLHNPYLGGYYPVHLTFEEARRTMRDDPPRFKLLVQDSLRRHVAAINTLVLRGMRFWDYGNAFLIEAYRAGAEIMQPGCSKSPDAGGTFRYPSYVQDIMGDIFSLGFGPFRWVCTSADEADLRETDEIAARVIRSLMAHADDESARHYADNLRWIEAAGANQLVVGSQARILYSNCEGRTVLATAFNEAIRSGRISAPVVLSRDHHDVSGTDSPYRETSNVYDGSAFTADMAVHNVIGDAARGATWVSIHNGGGVGWGEVINGGFGLTLDGSADAGRRASVMLQWDVCNGLARRSWAGNANALVTIGSEMKRHDGLVVTVPVRADETLVTRYAERGNSAEGGDGGGARGESAGAILASADRLAQLVGPAESPAAANRLRLLLINCRVATMSAESDAPYGLIEDAAIGVGHDGRIAFVCTAADAPTDAREVADQVRDLEGCLVTPGLIDCHTHIVYGDAGERVREWELKLSGVSYEEVARAGGGIAATVAATRRASAEQLARDAAPRVSALMRDGVTTLEIKSGYGLDAQTERRQLQAAELVAASHGCKVAKTFLGAHGVPSEYRTRGDLAYVEEVVCPLMSELHAEGLIDAVDAFYETIALSAEQTTRVFEHATSLGLRVRLHGDQLSDCGGAELAAEHRALSCDHCECTSAAGVAAMAHAGVVAVLLPASNLFMNETRLPPVQAFRQAGVRMAVATNCNPGTSPCASLLAAMHIACSKFRLSPEEALAGVTRHAAAALGRDDTIGTVEVGKAADLACWSCTSPAELCYYLGLNHLHASFIDGTEVQLHAGVPPQAVRPPRAVHTATSTFANGMTAAANESLRTAAAPQRVHAGAGPVRTYAAVAPARRPAPASTAEHPGAGEDRRLGSLIVHVGSRAPCPHSPVDLASIALIGFPYDEGCARNGGRRGAAAGPAAFREQVYKLGVTPHPVSGIDLAKHVYIVDLGDVDGYATLEEAHAALTRRVAEALSAGFTPFVVGGGNDQSYANARGLLDHVCRAQSMQSRGDELVVRSVSAGFGVVNIDAHLDVRPLKEGRVHSGSPFRLLLDDADFQRLHGTFVEFAAQPVQCAAAHAAFVRERGGAIVWHDEAFHAPTAFRDVLLAFGAADTAFVSFDVDAIRAADNPAVSCPSPVGLSASDALELCALAGGCSAVRLFDLSEFSPGVATPSEAFRSAQLVALMFYRFAHGRAARHADAEALASKA